jgi:hypothetical protein
MTMVVLRTLILRTVILSIVLIKLSVKRSIALLINSLDCRTNLLELAIFRVSYLN